MDHSAVSAAAADDDDDSMLGVIMNDVTSHQSSHSPLFKSPFLVQEPFVGPTEKYSVRIFKYSSLNQIGVINILFFSVARSSSLAQVR